MTAAVVVVDVAPSNVKPSSSCPSAPCSKTDDGSTSSDRVTVSTPLRCDIVSTTCSPCNAANPCADAKQERIGAQFAIEEGGKRALQVS